jgi:hypothetical protein
VTGRPCRAALVALLILFCRGASAADAPAKWQTFVSEEGGFSVLFPGTPRPIVDPPDPNGTKSHQFLVELGRTAYIVGYTDYKFGTFVGHTPQQVLDNARDKLVKGQPVKLLEDKAIALAGRAGREVAFEEKDGFTQIYDLYLVGDRLYQVISAGPKGHDKSAAAIRFRDSFRFIGQ